MSDVLNISEDSLTDSFIEENLEIIKKAAEGNTGAIEELRVAASKDILLHVIGETDFSKIDADLQNLQNEIASYALTHKLKIGAELDEVSHQAFLQKCTEIVQQAGMTAKQATEYFKALGYDVEVEEVTIKGGTQTRTQSGN